jgi:hypothetical protein
MKFTYQQAAVGLPLLPAKIGRSGLPFHLRSGTISGLRNGIFSMQGLKEILVGAITTQLAEPIDKKRICLTCVRGYVAGRLRNPANLLSTSR